MDDIRELALFAGAGGGLIASRRLGWRTVCAVEIDPFCRDVLIARQDNRDLDPFPIWDDVRTFDGKPWRGRVDIITGGFPCQDISDAGKRAGINGTRSGLFFELVRIIGEVRPGHVYLENVGAILGRGGAIVIGCLAYLGYTRPGWGIVSAADAGAPHLRKRWWCLAHAGESRLEGRSPFG